MTVKAKEKSKSNKSEKNEVNKELDDILSKLKECRGFVYFYFREDNSPAAGYHGSLTEHSVIAACEYLKHYMICKNIPKLFNGD